MAPSTLTQTATVKINPTTAIQLILHQVNVRGAETCLRVARSSIIAYLVAVVVANITNAIVIKYSTTVYALICLQIVKAETQVSIQQSLALSVHMITNLSKVGVPHVVNQVRSAMTPDNAFIALIQTARHVSMAVIIVTGVIQGTSW